MIKEIEKPVSYEVNQELRNITLHVQLRKHGGENVRVHVPATLLKICVEKDLEPSAILGKSGILKNLDLRDILKRVEQGERGNIITVTTKSDDVLEIIAQ